jgi:hypothetical protein
MDGEQQQAIGPGRLHESRSGQRPGGQVKRVHRLLAHHRRDASVALGGRCSGEIIDDQWHPPVGRHELDRLVAGERERRAQNLVSSDQRVERGLEHDHVDGPDAQAGGDDIGRASGVQLVKEPQPALGEREWRGPGFGAAGDRAVRGRSAPRQRRIKQRALGVGQLEPVHNASTPGRSSIMACRVGSRGSGVSSCRWLMRAYSADPTSLVGISLPSNPEPWVKGSELRTRSADQAPRPEATNEASVDWIALVDSSVRGGRSSAGRAPGCGPGGRGFESPRSPYGSPC